MLYTGLINWGPFTAKVTIYVDEYTESGFGEDSICNITVIPNEYPEGAMSFDESLGIVI
jgi:hypothetical protein